LAVIVRSIKEKSGLGTGDTSASSVHRWGHFDKLSASLGTLRQAQCIAGGWGHFGKLSASLGIGDWGLGIGDWGLGIGGNKK